MNKKQNVKNPHYSFIDALLCFFIVKLSYIMLSADMQGVIMLGVIMLGVFMLGVMAPQTFFAL